MTKQAFVFYQKKLEPGLSEIQSAIVAENFDFHLPIAFDISATSTISVQARFQSVESYFDYFQDTHDSASWGWSEGDLGLVSTLDTVSIFSAFANKHDIRGMITTAAVMTKLSGGVMHCDLLSDNLISSGESISYAKRNIKLPSALLLRLGKLRA